MIHVTWPPGCYGHYVMQSIYAYSNLSNGAELKIESTGSSHGFDAKPYFCFDHNLEESADIIIEPVQGHWLDYLNNQLLKAHKGDLIKNVETIFPDYKQSLTGYWEDINAPWAMREWISLWLYDVMSVAYKHVDGHISTKDLYTKNVFPKLINRLGLTVTVDDATMKHNQSKWIVQQRYHNSQYRCDKWIKDVIANNETDSPCQTILDEAYVQHCLRKQGYEIRCDGLDNFPKSSSELKELIYENGNTNN
jgi:hypothetical protein